jgi:hypothetical protein
MGAWRWNSAHSRPWCEMKANSLFSRLGETLRQSAEESGLVRCDVSLGSCIAYRWALKATRCFETSEIIHRHSVAYLAVWIVSLWVSDWRCLCSRRRVGVCVCVKTRAATWIQTSCGCECECVSRRLLLPEYRRRVGVSVCQDACCYLNTDVRHCRLQVEVYDVVESQINKPTYALYFISYIPCIIITNHKLTNQHMHCTLYHIYRALL